jgi:dihydroneopterin aldolase
MTALLASIATVAEIAPALSGGADILDLKDPAKGALGAWARPEIARAVAAIQGLRPISATVGDLPMEPALVAAEAAAVASEGVDIVKIGMFEGDRRACIAALQPLARETRLVAVLFADRDPDFALLATLKCFGFYGAMLDTADKSSGSLRAQLDDATIARFVRAARALDLLVGLAGSLALGDIAPLMDARPDYLGFRRALCGGKSRTAAIDADAVASVRAAMDAAQAAERKATATAGAQIAAE